MKLVSEADRAALMAVARVSQLAGVTVEEFAALLIKFDKPSMDDVARQMRSVLISLACENADAD